MSDLTNTSLVISGLFFFSKFSQSYPLIFVIDHCFSVLFSNIEPGLLFVVHYEKLSMLFEKFLFINIHAKRSYGTGVECIHGATTVPASSLVKKTFEFQAGSSQNVNIPSTVLDHFAIKIKNFSAVDFFLIPFVKFLSTFDGHAIGSIRFG